MLCAICKSSKYMQNMSIQSQNNKRLAKNTLILYARMLFTVGISFYSTRLILANLGVSDYGVYNVIGGFVSMFYMVTATMTQAVSRFLTFELGRNDPKKLQQNILHIPKYSSSSCSVGSAVERDHRLMVCQRKAEYRARPYDCCKLDLSVLPSLFCS